MTDTCQTCRFFKLTQAGVMFYGDGPNGRKVDRGECRIRSVPAQFPTRCHDDGCGEHEQQPGATTTTLME